MRVVILTILMSAIWLRADIIEQKSNTEESLRGISAVSPSIVWASGTHGTYLRTADGGATWEVGHVPDAGSLDFRDVQAFSADMAFLLAAGPGEQSRIYKTIDGGKTWTVQFINKDPKGFFDCMAFWDSDSGIAVGDPVNGKFQLIKTENGKDWKPVPAANLPLAIEGEGAFAASGTCIAVQGKKNVWFVSGGRAARVFRSRDAGETWSVAETPIVHGPASAGSFSIAFRDAKHGVIAGGDYKEPIKEAPSIAFTNDGGKSWQLSRLSPQKYFSAVVFDPSRPKRVVAAGTAQYASTKGITEKKWEVFLPLVQTSSSQPESAQLNAIGISPTGSKVWVVGAKGAIFLIDDICRACTKK